jgi:hypothetical protein
VRVRLISSVAAVLVGVVTFVPSAPAESLEACAQRVIRDWYSGGRVDRIYPLRCYRAAIRALPNDVLQYSDADRDIARALAYARRGETVDAVMRQRPTSSATATVTEDAKRAAPKQRAAPKEIGGPLRLASGPEPAPASGGLPYPIIALALLSGVLFVSAAAGWLVRRGH